MPTLNLHDSWFCPNCGSHHGPPTQHPQADQLCQKCMSGINRAAGPRFPLRSALAPQTPNLEEDDHAEKD